MSEPYLGQVVAVGFNFAPVGWLSCNGQLLAIADYTALFALLGTSYGGDGQTTFAVPNLQGRVAIHQGQGANLSNYVLGQQAGAETSTLDAAELPAHSHQLLASAQAGSTNTPGSGVALATATSAPIPIYALPAGADVALSPAAVSMTGSSQPHDNQQPYLVINYIIAYEGVFPSRS